MSKFFKSLYRLLKATIVILFLGAVTYYCIDKIQEKNNLMDIEEYSPKSSLVVPKNLLLDAPYI